MPKPIFIISLPRATQDHVKSVFKNIPIQLKYDYHVLVYSDMSILDVKFQLFSDKEIEPIELQKLKDLLKC